MHPISSNFFGPSGLAVSFNNGSAIVTGYILKQTSWTKYLVTDGTHTLSCKLAQTLGDVAALPYNNSVTPPASTFTVPLQTQSAGTGASFVVNYSVTSATPSGGVGYAVGNTATLPSGTNITISAVSGGVPTALTVSNSNAVFTSVVSAPQPATTATGTGHGLTVSLGFQIASVTVTGGTNYATGQALAFVGLVGTVQPVATISAVTGSTPTTVAISQHGNGIAQAASSVVVTTPLVASAKGSGATFTPSYAVYAAAPTGGTAYTVGTTVSLPNGVHLTVSAVTGGVPSALTITTNVTVNTVNHTAMPATTLTGAGTGLTVTLSYSVASVTVTGGSGYEAGASLVFTGMTATTLPRATIGTVSASGQPQSVVVGTAGTGITVGASSVTVAGGPEYASRLYGRTLLSVTGNRYSWMIGGDQLIAALVPSAFYAN